MSKYIESEKLIAEIERRIEETKSMKPAFDQFWAGQISAFKGVKNIIQVDGGVNENTILDAKNAGATSFVIGSYFTKNLDEFEEKLLKINKLIFG